MDGGTYTLLLELDGPATVAVGALGEHELPAGGYAYTGSALGPGGFARVDRHAELAAGERDAAQWHVDRLLRRDGVRLAGDVRSPGAAVECAVARRLPGGPVPGFGASDCGCDAHLAGPAPVDELSRLVATAHEAARRAAGGG